MNQKRGLAGVFLLLAAIGIGGTGEMVGLGVFAEAAWAQARSADAQPAQLDSAQEKLSAAQRQFQKDILNALALRWPHLGQLLNVQLELQLALNDARGAKFYFLLRNHPEKIVRDQGIGAFLNFDWSEEDEARLRASNAAYAAIEKRISDARRQSDGHPLWPESREKFQSIRKEPDVAKAFEQLAAATEEAEAMLRAAAGK